MAVGARTSAILAMVIGHSMRLCAVGLAAGTLGAFALRRVLSLFVFGVSASDPAVYLLAVGSMLAVALLAC